MSRREDVDHAGHENISAPAEVLAQGLHEPNADEVPSIGSAISPTLLRADLSGDHSDTAALAHQELEPSAMVPGLT